MTDSLGSYKIPDRNIDRLEEQLAKLNKRAKRLGVEPVTITRDSFTDVVHDCVKHAHIEIPGDCAAKGSVARTWAVTVHGETPKYAGWEFVATIEHTGDENIVRCVPSKELPVAYRTADRVCDQCKLVRNRRDTYVVAQTFPVVGIVHKQVGSDCIKDFLGHQNPQALASWAEALSAFSVDLDGAEDEGWELGGGGREYIYGEEYLQHVAACIRSAGWLSRGKARENAQFDDGRPTYATADRAYDNLFPSPEMKKRNQVVAIEQPDKDRAAAALAWAENVLHEIDDNDLNDYLHNLRAVTKSATIERKHIGLFASLLPTAEREGEKAERVEREKTENATKVHVGTVGKREVFKNLTVKRVTESANDYGPLTIISFEDADKNALVWFKSGANGSYEPTGRYYTTDDDGNAVYNNEQRGAQEYAIVGAFEAGAAYDVKATVKKHNGNDRYGPQTILSRVVMVKKVEVAV